MANQPGEYSIEFDTDDWFQEQGDYANELIQESVGSGLSAGAAVGTTVGGLAAAAAGVAASGPGAIGAGIGMLVGLLIGGVDAAVKKKSLEARMETERARREMIESDIEDAMNYRADIVRHAEALLHPMEQAFRTRARAWGAQFAAKGLSGSQAIYAQLQAEEMYRSQVGPNLPGIMIAAEKVGQQKAMLELAALEKKYNIDVAYAQLDFAAEKAAGDQGAAAASGWIKGMAGMGQMFGGAIADHAGGESTAQAGFTPEEELSLNRDDDEMGDTIDQALS